MTRTRRRAGAAVVRCEAFIPTGRCSRPFCDTEGVTRPPTLRPADSADAEFIVEMLRVAMDWDPQRPSTTIERMRGLPDIWHYVDGWQRPTDFGCVALDEVRPVGAAWGRFFTGDDPGYGFVREDVAELSMGVVAEDRGRGVGAALLDRVIAEARDRDLAGLSLSVEDGNAPARALYESRGFVVVGREGNSDTMLLELREPN